MLTLVRYSMGPYINLQGSQGPQASGRAGAGAEQKGELSDPPSFAETQKLPYLQAVLKECLRVHPTVGLPLWREVTAGGATIAGKSFPAGTNVGINSWVAHRNRDVWGPDADDFRPERWIESSEDQLREMNAMFMLFGLIGKPSVYRKEHQSTRDFEGYSSTREEV